MLLHTVLLLLGSLAVQQAIADGGWNDGRASFYGNDGGTTIHQGSCMFGQLDGSKGTGYDIAALSDQFSAFDQSCGRCYEVRCRPATFSDGYGQQLNRQGACFDPSRSVVVMISDACPCYYPNNAYSNKRWCCGDMFHMDLSFYAFQKLADLHWGVMGIQWREVSCPPGTPQAQGWQKSDRNRKGRPGTTYKLL